MSSPRTRLIRAAIESPELRPIIIPYTNHTTGYPIDRFITVGDLAWTQAARDARDATLAALPPCKCMGPTASILDYGRGPILDVSYGHDISSEEMGMMDRAVSALGWRGWAYGDRGIAFKPTDVDLGPND